MPRLSRLCCVTSITLLIPSSSSESRLDFVEGVIYIYIGKRYLYTGLDRYYRRAQVHYIEHITIEYCPFTRPQLLIPYTTYTFLALIVYDNNVCLRSRSTCFWHMDLKTFTQGSPSYLKSIEGPWHVQKEESFCPCRVGGILERG